MAKQDRLSRDLVQLALDFHRLRPWTRVGPTAPFLVRAPGEDEPLGCFVLGGNGETIWLDASVPALEGRTPRAAYRDPSTRELVERMVRTYPDSRTPWGIVAAPREEMLRELRRE